MTKNRTIGDILFQGTNTQTLSSSAGEPVWNDNIKPGDIIITFYDGTWTGYVKLNGATITNGAIDYPIVAARYSWMVSGNNLILPTLNGQFPRSWAHTSANDPDRASRIARAGDGQTGDYPGTRQNSDYQFHYHEYYRFISGGSWADGAANSRTWIDGTATGAYGGNETRPINIYVMHLMKMG